MGNTAAMPNPDSRKDDPHAEMLKVAEVASRLRVDQRTVYRMIRRGQLRAVRVGRLFRIPAEALKAYLAGQG